MADKCSTQKKVLMSSMATATSQEANGADIEAFGLYLSSVQGVCELLGSRCLPPVDRLQVITLAKQCLDRIHHLSDVLAQAEPKMPLEAELRRDSGDESQLDQRQATALDWRLRRLRGVPEEGGVPHAQPWTGRRSSEAWSTYRAASLSEPPTDAAETEDSDECTSIEDNRLVPSLPSAPPSSAANDAESTPEGVDLDGVDSTQNNQQPDQQELHSPTEEEEGFNYDEFHPRFPIPKPVEALDDSGEPSPLDAARRENERLVASYAMRMQRSPPHVQHNLRLELQRRLSENRQIATMKNRAWLQRRQEARQHHLDVAKRVFEADDSSSSNSGGCSSELLQKQATFADILQFEATHGWTTQVRRSLDANPDSERAVENALLHMLLEKSHPLSKLRQRLQYSLYCKISPLVEQHAHLLDAVRVPSWSPLSAELAAGHVTPQPAEADRLTPTPDDQTKPRRQQAAEPDAGVSAAVAFPARGSAAGGVAAGPVAAEGWDIDTPPAEPPDSDELALQTEAFRRHLRNAISDTQDSVRLLESLTAAVHGALAGAAARAVLQRLLFTPLWPHLLVLFRLANWRQEALLASAIRRCRRPRHCPAAELGGRPQPAARRLLRRLLQAAAPADKCRLLVDMVRQLCQADSGEAPAGADLLLPRLTQLVVHAAAPQLVSELQFMSEFMSEGSFQGEQGYCLTSLQTVLLYLVQQE